jgi:hypothetical protein
VRSPEHLKFSLHKQVCLMLVLFLSLPLTTISGTVTYNYARGVSVANFLTFEWLDMEGTRAVDGVLDEQIRAAIEAELARKGFRMSDHADLLVLYQLSDRREKEIRMYSPDGVERYGPGWRYGESYGFRHGYSFVAPSSMSTATSSIIPIGNLVLDVYDATYHDLVWRGEISKLLDASSGTHKGLANLNRAIAQLFEAFPSRTGK